ncbi:MAG TPA: Crp/Fnr family transcriptional regulator [Mesorhizobium sp.]|jgi:CRP-like cAMP-binding protein|nr:Crp/Fnr family transcriptional regulator [Mesorhizobium sp.]
MPRVLIRKLEHFTELSDEEKRMLQDASRNVKVIEAHQDIINEGDKPDDVHLILDGWALRYKGLLNGDRAILAFLIPGDICDLHVALLDQMDHSIAALSRCRVAFIPLKMMEEVMDEGRERQRNSRGLARALWWSTLRDEAILREWLVNLGQRNADKRLAHFFCEMLLRSKAVGLTDDDSFELPMTQEELGDATGMTTVHISRTLKDLQERGLVTVKGRRVVMDNLDGLMAFADFNPNYLHHKEA